MTAPVGRLAPSPTGLLHLGHARSFLLAWWSVRARGGRMLLRMEDLDTERMKPGMADDVLRDLEWLGLEWDGEVVYQSERRALYRSALDGLARDGLLYPCVCTRREIELAQSAPHLDDGTRRYPGTCDGRFESLAAAEEATGRHGALRFRVPAGRLMLDDAFVGRFESDVADEVGDFPVAKRDGAPAYQLAVVVDDADQGVTEVLRGDDLLPSTARQALLQRAARLPHPTWVHVPLVVDEEGRRLAKRHDDLALARLRSDGVDPRAVVAWAAASAGIDVGERAEPRDAVSTYALDRLPRSPAVLTQAALETILSARF